MIAGGTDSAGGAPRREGLAAQLYEQFARVTKASASPQRLELLELLAQGEMTLSQVKSSLPTDTIIVPGHDRPTTISGFDFSIHYLSAMVGGVSSSVSQGLTVEQTVSTVTLPSFQGYAIWDWIHKQVNVPNTYAEIKK